VPVIKRHKDFYAQFSVFEILKSLLTGLIFTALIMAPFIVIIINAWFLFIYHIYLITLLAISVVSLTFLVWALLFGKTLTFYQKDHETMDWLIIITDGLILTAICLITGIIAMLMIVPGYL